MLPELQLQIKSISRLIYFVTEEEDRLLLQFQEMTNKKVKNAKDGPPPVKVWNATMGLQPLNTVIEDWGKKTHPKHTDTMSIHNALETIYKEGANNKRAFYILLDPERYLADPQVQRRMLNLLHQGNNNINTAKVIVCISNTLKVPDKLSRYTEVVHDTGLTNEEISGIVNHTCGHLGIEDPENPGDLFKGLTEYEIKSALIQTYKRTNSGCADPRLLAQYRFNQLKKTNLIRYVDTTKWSFDLVGGAGRLKEWASKTAAAWTPEGQEFGLEPPKGVLAVGVWGTGKSISIKSLSNAWRLPMLQLDLGKLRQSGVGDSEANTYRVISIIESMAPCIVWIDEAEKSLSGGSSSAHTDGGTGSRMIGALSTWHQETDAKVCLAMTANSLATLPVEFVNRMDERWFFDLPSLDDRQDILKIHLTKRGLDSEKYNLFKLGEAAKEMVGREIEQSIKAAWVESFHQGKKTLDEELLLKDLKKRPRIVRTMHDEIQEVTSWVGYDETVEDGVRARYAADPKGRSNKDKFSIG